MNRPRLSIAALLVATLVAIGPLLPGVAQARTSLGVPRVAIIVGPVGSLTDEYRRIGREAAVEARRWTPDVVTVFSPNATWPAVRAAIQGASVVIYLGHGNGWPSPYRHALFDGTQNGFGLNPVAGGGDDAHQYFGAAYLRSEVRLAPGAVVLLHRLCYASGNSEPGVPEGTIDAARQRIDNFAAGFIASGAGAVVADAFASPAAYLRQLLGRGTPAITAWRTSATAQGHISSFDSVRTPGALAFMDPDTQGSGFYRSIVLAAHTAQTMGPGGPGTGQGTSVPDAIAPVIILPGVPPAPSLAALGAISGPPTFDDRPVMGATTMLTVPLRMPARTKLPAGLEVGVRWTPIDLSPVVSTGTPGDPGSTPGTPGTPSGSGSPAPTATPQPTTTPTPPPGSAIVGDPTPLGTRAGAGRASGAGLVEGAIAAQVPSAGPAEAAAPSPAPTASPAPDPTPSPDPGSTPDPSAPPATPDPLAPDTSLPPVGDLLAGPDQVVAEQSSAAVEVTRATVVPNALRVPVQLPSAPGRYRLVVTLHGADGVALDAQTQALVPALLVRVAGPIDVTYSVPARARAGAGGTLRLLVTVANSGTLAWDSVAGALRGGSPQGIDGPVAAEHRPVLVGRWLPLDPGGNAGDGAPAEAVFDASPGESAAVSLALRAPTIAGTYLVVLDVRSPVLGSLAARGAKPATVIVDVASLAP